MYTRLSKNGKLGTPSFVERGEHLESLADITGRNRKLLGYFL
jgi:hypothetical protein